MYAIRRRTVVRNRLLVISPLNVVHGSSQRWSPQVTGCFAFQKLLTRLAQKEPTPVGPHESAKSSQAPVVC